MLSVVLRKAYIEMMGYVVQTNLNIRIDRDITGEMWFGVG
jgi:hypothetical protein